MKRWRVKEQVTRLTGFLRSEEVLPQALHELLTERGVSLSETALADIVEDQGCNLSGALVTSEGRVIDFDIDFEGTAYGAWREWSEILSINHWKEWDLRDQPPKQGTDLDLAFRMLRQEQL